MKWIGVGPRSLVILAAIALVAGLTLWTTIQYGESKEKQKILEEQNQTYVQTRKRVDEAVKTNRGDDVDLARKWLLERQNRNK